ncbi:MAG TPA: hypothetical protein VFX15_14360, partial [Actinomycetes bacterium]|nr:hypothetical protein [Actinomycetes bacterium]
EDLGTLGPGEWLPPVLERNVADVGETPESPVVLVAAGSTEESARVDLVAASGLWQASRPGRVLTAAVSGPDPRPEQVIASLGSAASEAVVVPFMLAPGALADRAAAAAQSAGVPCAATITAKDRTPPELVAHLAHRLQPT